jgi:hypothetical protein
MKRDRMSGEFQVGSTKLEKLKELPKIYTALWVEKY